MHDEIAFSRARTVKLTDADRGRADRARGVDLRVGYGCYEGREDRLELWVWHSDEQGPL